MVRLDDLVAALPAAVRAELIGDPAVGVTGATHDSRDVVPGDLFACIEGDTTDGHMYAASAVAAGAAALLVSRPVDVDVPQIVVDDSRAVLGHVASAVHGHPSRSLTVVGITGTNGKTTTAHLLGGILRASGAQVEVFGTLTGARTTPEATDLQRRLAMCRDAGVSTVVMEVSSHALALHRVVGTAFDLAVFTNLGRDHLDLHGTAEEYFRAKARLFAPDLTVAGVVNIDDPAGRLLLDAAEIPVQPYSASDATEVVVALDQLRFVWRGIEVTAPLGGVFNVSNSVAALTAAVALGSLPADAASALAAVGPVPGRFEIIEGAGIVAVVDYAHTPEGLTALLESVIASRPSGRTIIVFGCGGDRDRDKRPAMGAAATAADVVIVTSDNPRGEEPSSIAADIVAGMSTSEREQVTVELDRRRAIEIAVERATPGDVVVIAGKGHETIQTIGNVDRPFDDREVVRSAMTAVERSRT